MNLKKNWSDYVKNYINCINCINCTIVLSEIKLLMYLHCFYKKRLDKDFFSQQMKKDGDNQAYYLLLFLNFHLFVI